jgi:hypothetical protein
MTNAFGPSISIESKGLGLGEEAQTIHVATVEQAARPSNGLVACLTTELLKLRGLTLLNSAKPELKVVPTK